MTIKIIFIILLFFTYVLPKHEFNRPWFKYQTFCAEISFKCNGIPYKGVRALIYDYFLGFYSLLGSRNLSDTDYLSFCGFVDGLISMDPYLYFYHQCNENSTKCQEEIYLHIPKEYVFWGTNATKSYVDNHFELNKTHPGRNRQCIVNGKLKKHVPYGKDYN